MKQISHSINRSGEVVPGNGFKQPTPTIASHNRGIWMHSIDRSDAATPFQGFVVLGVVVIVAYLIIILL